MNQWALITGASAGIGYEFARLFAREQFNLVLVARSAPRLEKLADELRAAHGVEVEVLAKDLAQPSAAAEIFDQVRSTPIEVLVNNAGFGSYGAFADTDLAISTEILQVNLIALVQLTHRFLQPMRARGHGRILQVASTAAFQPGPNFNVYYASKAFVYSFAYALAEELAGTGITVTTLCPGLTRTEFQARAHLAEAQRWGVMEADVVAALGFRGLMRGKRVVIPGGLNQVASFVAKRVPPRLTSAVVRRIHSKR